MRAQISYQNRLVIFDFFPDKDDEDHFSNDVHLGNRSCSFLLPSEIDAERLHQDVLALSILLASYPFIKSRLTLSFPVSRDFAESVRTNLGLKIEPIESKIVRRQIHSGRPGLAYSGGVDSTAALALMPVDTAVCFLDRIQPSFKKTLYNKEAAQLSLEDVREKGYDTYSTPSNLEYLRSKVGFPVDSLNPDMPIPACIPILLLADTLNIDAVAFGIVMESVYWVGHEAYKEFTEDEYYKKWSPLFDQVNCPLYFPVAGLSEVATSIVCTEFAISRFSRSCMRGDKSSSCGKCAKCFRKLLLDRAVSRTPAPMDSLLVNLNSKEVLRNVYGNIHQHENVYRYIAEQLPDNNLVQKLRERIHIDCEDTTWMERWYPRSEELVPSQYREMHKQKICRYISTMSINDIAFVEGWNAEKKGNKNKIALKSWQDYVYSKLSDTGLKNFARLLKVNDSEKFVSKAEKIYKWIKRA